jgi:Ca2+-binding RTX toxin-like protein
MSPLRIVLAAALLVALAPASAHAGALSITGTAPSLTLRLDAQDGLNHIASARVSGDSHRHLVVEDHAGIDVATTGCTLVDPGTADCGAVEGYVGLVVMLGTGDDVFTVPWADVYNLPFPISVDGGDGDDFLQGSEGLDELRGGAGDDVLDAIDPYLPQADALLSCGDGIDAIVFDEGTEAPGDDCEIAGPPNLGGDLQITGDPRVGNVLGLSLPTNVGGDGEGTVQWERCDASGYDCTDIAGAQAATYMLTAADLGLRLRAWYSVENTLGDDWVESAPTAIVRAASQPPAPRPPRPTVPRPPRPRVTVPTFVIPPLVTVRKPYFALPNGDPIVDTGRTVLCPGAPGGVPCRLKVTARPSGASARWRRRPASAGETSVLLAAGRPGRVRVPLNLRAYRLLRAHHKLTLSVTATITRPHSKLMRSTFTITVRTPAHKRR